MCSVSGRLSDDLGWIDDPNVNKPLRTLENFDIVITARLKSRSVMMSIRRGLHLRLCSSWRLVFFLDLLFAFFT